MGALPQKTNEMDGEWTDGPLPCYIQPHKNEKRCRQCCVALSRYEKKGILIFIIVDIIKLHFKNKESNERLYHTYCGTRLL